ncbi:MAG TPA: 1-deoxy-D-xylulose-5-phosphate synthase N-terminal domain-containing protein [Polyangiaceae bacterium]|nr:1-deoxy-D-xylulose-5-phosphate synthase N-terminal domain-containing protein [Polyangiaceae bacterium]
MNDASLFRSLREDALAVRRQFLRMHFDARAGHLGTGLSDIDILVYLHKVWLAPGDQFILSKGHGASSLYATLHHFGRLTDEALATYYKDGTLLPAHPAPRARAAIPAATGSLGHGLPIAAGLAYAYKYLFHTTQRVACLVSDGECNSGSLWEAALFAAQHRLDNLTVIVDANGLQGFGRTKDVMDLEPFVDKWRAFRFRCQELDGHDFAQLHAALQRRAEGQPSCVVARTVKGKGVSLMEDKLEWHYLPMNEEQYARALEDLADAERRLKQQP